MDYHAEDIREAIIDLYETPDEMKEEVSVKFVCSLFTGKTQIRTWEVSAHDCDYDRVPCTVVQVTTNYYTEVTAYQGAAIIRLEGLTVGSALIDTRSD